MIDEIIARKIREGVRYEALSERYRQAIPLGEWKSRVRDSCVQRGLQWEGTLASAACTQTEYYEHLVKVYKAQQRLYPYHMAHYIARVLRITPFKYYFDIMYQALRTEFPYDQIPNFTAAEMVQMLGIGRNEYIAALNACKEKKLLWRVNKAIAREHLPSEPLPPKYAPWWRVVVVNIGTTEWKEVVQRESELLTKASQSQAGCPACECDKHVLLSVYKRGFIYFDVPISPSARFSIPPLEGFVSNRDSVVGEADPMEALLYEVFVANSERVPLDELARILDKPLPDIQNAISIACRLGFATPVDEEASSPVHSVHESAGEASGSIQLSGEREGEKSAVAIVLDAQATSFLMMGSLSPGMKKHSVTLFEGGRIAGDDVVKDMLAELWSSVEAGAGFEGEMAHIVGVLESLAIVLQTVRNNVQGHSVELIRKESLSSLAHAAAARVLALTYRAVVPIEPLPLPALPVPLSSPRGPAFFGASSFMLSPWLQLALLHQLQRGPVSLVFVRGQRITRLPPQAHGCTHALVWAWDSDKWPAKEFGQTTVPHLLDATFLLYVLNGLLVSTAVLVQPLWLSAADSEPTYAKSGQQNSILPVVQLGLPLVPVGEEASCFKGIAYGSEDVVAVRVVPGLVNTLRLTGLEMSVGHLLMIPLSACTSPSLTLGAPDDSLLYVPYAVALGMPVYNVALCRQINEAAETNGIFTEAGIRRQVTQQQFLLQVLADFVNSFVIGAASERGASVSHGVVEQQTVLLPPHNLIFDGHALNKVDMPQYIQAYNLQTSFK